MFRFFVFFAVLTAQISVFGVVYKVEMDEADTDTLKILGTLDVLGARKENGKLVYIIHATPNEIIQLPGFAEITPLKMDLDFELSYPTIEEIDNRIAKIGAAGNGYASVFNIGNSIEGRNIKAVRISAIKEATEETPEILFVGGTHAREWISYEVPLAIAEFFVEYADSNPVINDIINNSVIWFIPALNPDGYVYSYEHNRMWRNNRREHPDGSFGVDLNRNYDSEWIEIDFVHGTEPFSEPETRAVRDFILDGEKFGVKTIDGLISYHSFGQMILYPPGSRMDPPENVELYQTVGFNMADLIFNECGEYYVTMQIKDLYMTYGEMTEWFMNISGNKLSYTFELRPTFHDVWGFRLPEEFIPDSIKENIPPAVYFIRHVISGETFIEGDVNGDGIFDALENTVYDYSECFVYEEEKEKIEPIEPIEDNDDNEEPDFSDDLIPEDDTDDTGSGQTKKSSGCSIIL